jgi:hypothetical protein
LCVSFLGPSKSGKDRIRRDSKVVINKKTKRGKNCRGVCFEVLIRRFLAVKEGRALRRNSFRSPEWL